MSRREDREARALAQGRGATGGSSVPAWNKSGGPWRKGVHGARFSRGVSDRKGRRGCEPHKWPKAASDFGRLNRATAFTGQELSTLGKSSLPGGVSDWSPHITHCPRRLDSQSRLRPLNGPVKRDVSRCRVVPGAPFCTPQGHRIPCLRDPGPARRWEGGAHPILALF